jgi:NAD(P)-dependent dehydrogenase (short-subunit alcohol dehydrogenase family)
VQSWIAELAPQSSSATLNADLSLLSETRDVGNLITSRHSKIAVLVNNAGIFDVKRIVTQEGHERVLATNLFAPFLLTRMLMPALIAGAPSRVINIGSSASDYARVDPDHLVLGRRWTMLRAYSQSKLAMMMVTFALAKRLLGTGVVTNVVHPGLVATGLVRAGGVIGLAWRCLAPWALTQEQGADAPLYAALAPELASVSGFYFKNRKIARPNHQALDSALVERIWTATEDFTASPSTHAFISIYQ